MLWQICWQLLVSELKHSLTSMHVKIFCDLCIPQFWSFLYNTNFTLWNIFLHKIFCHEHFRDKFMVYIQLMRCTCNSAIIKVRVWCSTHATSNIIHITWISLCGDDMLWLWLWGLPQSDQIYTVCSLVHWACGLSAGYSWNLFFLRQIFTWSKEKRL